MRRPFAPLAALVVMGIVGSTPAVADTTLDSSVRLTPKRLGKKAPFTGTKLSARFRFTTDASDPPLVTRVRLRLPRAIEFNGGDYPQCAYDVMYHDNETYLDDGVGGCPAGSLMGSGQATRVGAFAGPGPTIIAVNGGADTIWAFTTMHIPRFVRMPAPISVTRTGPRQGPQLDLAFPVPLWIVAANPALDISSLHLVLGGMPHATRYLAATRRCPKHRSLPYRAIANVLASDGTMLELQDGGRIPCV